MGDLKRLPVLIRDKAGLDQEAVDKTENHREEHEADPEETCNDDNITVSERERDGWRWGGK